MANDGAHTRIPDDVVGRHLCPECGTAWTAPVNDCPTCGNEDVDELAAIIGVDADVIEMIRRDERLRVSQLLDSTADTIARFVPDAQRAVELVAYMLTLGSGVNPEVTS